MKLHAWPHTETFKHKLLRFEPSPSHAQLSVRTWSFACVCDRGRGLSRVLAWGLLTILCTPLPLPPEVDDLQVLRNH